MNDFFIPVKRLVLGFSLIAAASAVLLFSDLRSRKGGSQRPTPAAQPAISSDASVGLPPSASNLTGPKAPPGRTFRIGMAYFAPEQAIDSCMAGLMEGLKELGFEEQKNLRVTRTHAQGEMVNIPAMMENLDNSDADMLVTFTTPILQGACFRVKHKRVIFTCVTDPIAAGAGKSWTDHVPHVTGVGSFPPLEDTMNLIPRLLPQLKSLGVLYNSGEANSAKIVSVLRTLTEQKQIKLVELTAASSGEVLQAAQGLVSHRVDAIYIPSDNTAYQALEAIMKVAGASHTPVFNDDAEYLSRGMVASMGPGYFHSGKAAAPYVARVLLGESPADMPMTNVSVNVTAFNREMAKALGISIPADLLRQSEATQARPLTSATSANAAPAHRWNVHFIELNDVPAIEESRRGVLAGLEEAGLQNGRDYEPRFLNAQGDVPTLGAMVDTAIADGTDLVIAISTLSLQAALKKVKDRPIVFAQVTDPMKAGAGKSLHDHLPNVTGSSPLSDHDQIIRVIRQCLPSCKTIGTLFNPSEDNSVIQKDGLMAAAQRAGMNLHSMSVNQSADIPNAAVALCRDNIEAVCQISDNLTSAAFSAIVRATRQSRIPLFCYQSPQAEAGGTIAVARDFLDAGKAAGKLAARIIRGESPAKLPFESVSHTRLIINQKEAETLGLQVPPSLLSSADAVIDANGYHLRQKP